MSSPAKDFSWQAFSWHQQCSNHKSKDQGVLLWLSGLRIQSCHYSDLACCCGMGFDPWSRNFHMPQVKPKKKKKLNQGGSTFGTWDSETTRTYWELEKGSRDCPPNLSIILLYFGMRFHHWCLLLWLRDSAQSYSVFGGYWCHLWSSPRFKKFSWHSV